MPTRRASVVLLLAVLLSGAHLAGEHAQRRMCSVQCAAAEPGAARV
jgi:hypothetical protein